ncbi:MAG: hypothetical protein AB1491_00185 [Thermodesulfobacteriota bacterium]
MLEQWTRWPRKARLFLLALYAGWAPDPRRTSFPDRKITLKKASPDGRTIYYLEFPPEIKTLILAGPDEKKRHLSVLAEIHYRSLRFDPHDPFRIVGIPPRRLDFDLKKPHLGLQLGEAVVREEQWLQKIREVLAGFFREFGRAPGAEEFYEQIRKKISYHPNWARRMVRKGRGRYWQAVLEPNKVNPRSRGCIYYYPIF